MNAAWTTEKSPPRDRDVRLADWFAPKAAPGEVAALFAPEKPKPAPKPKVAAPAPVPKPSPETTERLALLTASLKEIEEARRADRAQTIELTIEIALAVAEELAMGALKTDRKRLERLVVESVGMMDDELQMRVHLHPELIELFEASDMLARLLETQNVVIESDPSVGVRGCIVESATQRVDARMKVRIERLRQLLRAEEGIEA